MLWALNKKIYSLLNMSLLKIKTSLDRSENIGIVAIFIVSSICVMYASKIVNPSGIPFIINLAIFNFCFLLLFLFEISFRHSRKNEKFKIYITSINHIFETKVEKKIFHNYSLLKRSIEYLTYFLSGTIPAILCLWIVHFFNELGAWSIFVIYFLFINFYFRKKWKQFIPIYLMFFCTIIPTLLSNDFYFAALGIGFISGVILIGDLVKKKMRTKKFISDTSSISNFFVELKKLTTAIFQNIYSNNTINTFQGLLVGISIFVIFVTPNLSFIVPKDFQKIIEPYIDTLPKIQENLSYILFFFYCAFSFYQVIEDILKKLSFKDENNIWKRILNWGVFFFVFIFLSPLILIPSTLFIILFLFMGEVILGNDFIVIIGFFVFPLFGAYLNTFIYLLILLILPLPIIKRIEINEIEMRLTKNSNEKTIPQKSL